MATFPHKIYEKRFRKINGLFHRIDDKLYCIFFTCCVCIHDK